MSQASTRNRTGQPSHNNIYSTEFNNGDRMGQSVAIVGTVCAKIAKLILVNLYKTTV